MKPGQFYEQYWQGDYDDPLAPGRAKALWEAVDQLSTRPQTFLDVGCGRGELVADAARRGMRAIGTDVSETAVAQARAAHPMGEFRVLSADDRPWPVRDVDLVVSFEVIEHLFWPRDLIEGAFEALRPGGHFALSTPYHGRLKNVALSLARFDRHFDVDGQHIRFFSDAALRKVLTEAGFEVKQTLHFGRAPGIWANTMMWAQRPR